jgi:hypothetical protein
MESWSKFRRGLRREDQQALDDLFRAARLQLAGSAYAARPVPFESIVMSMLVAQHRRITALEQALRGPLTQETPHAGTEAPLVRALPPAREPGKETDGEHDDHRLGV